MRAFALCMLLGAAVTAGCASEPSIACSTDEQCLDGQYCSAGWCSAASASSTMSDAAMQGDAPPSSSSDAAMPDAPAICSPTCSGSTPYCDDGTCVQCTSALHCPLTAPRCVDNACTL